MADVIHVVAACLFDNEGRLVLVRKRGTQAFMMPGGKPEAGETARQALQRELEEELNWQGHVDTLTAMGTFEAAAANEAGMRVRADVFWGALDHAVQPQAELEELVTVTLAQSQSLPLAPLQAILEEKIAALPLSR